MNSVHIIGNLTNDVELKTFSSGNKVAKFSIAVNRKRKNAQMDEETCFVEIEAWGKTAEVASNYLNKGNRIGVSGYLKQENWLDKDGKKRSKHIVSLEKLYFLEAKQQPQKVAPQAQEVQEPYIEFIDSDVPF